MLGSQFTGSYRRSGSIKCLKWTLSSWCSEKSIVIRRPWGRYVKLIKNQWYYQEQCAVSFLLHLVQLLTCTCKTDSSGVRMPFEFCDTKVLKNNMSNIHPHSDVSMWELPEQFEIPKIFPSYSAVGIGHKGLADRHDSVMTDLQFEEYAHCFQEIKEGTKNMAGMATLQSRTPLKTQTTATTTSSVLTGQL